MRGILERLQAIAGYMTELDWAVVMIALLVVALGAWMAATVEGDL